MAALQVDDRMVVVWLTEELLNTHSRRVVSVTRSLSFPVRTLWGTVLSRQQKFRSLRSRRMSIVSDEQGFVYEKSTAIQVKQDSVMTYIRKECALH
jgi:hypothetical protein